MGENSELIILGDKVLIAPDETKARTSSGLFLPQGIEEHDKVQSGRVARVGPGYILPHLDSSEPWLNSKNEPYYVPLQVKEGDVAIFLRKEAMEIEYDDKKYLIVSQSGILAVVRDRPPTDELDRL